MSARRKLLLILVTGVVGLGVLILAAAFGLLFVGDPSFSAPVELAPEAMAELVAHYEQPYPAEPRSFTMRDGTTLQAAVQAGAGDTGPVDTVVVLVHGVLSSSLPLNRPAGLLRTALAADVVAVDLRGHGASGGMPGDVDYIGQYEDDLADVIAALRRERPGRRVVLAGHSMGGGIALRYAEKAAAGAAPPVDGYLLFAPHLGVSAPTMRTEPAGEGPAFLKLNIPRTLGLALLNQVGITGLNGMRTLFFNLPPELPLRTYSYRAMVGGTPEDYRRALAAVEAPLLVVVGAQDEAFRADRFAEVLAPKAGAELAIIDSATHDGVLYDPRSFEAVQSWAEGSIRDAT